jgi:hypothetical protein
MNSEFCEQCNNTGIYSWKHNITIQDSSHEPVGEINGRSYCFCKYGVSKRENRNKISNELDRFLHLSDDEVLEIISNKQRHNKAETN